MTDNTQKQFCLYRIYSDHCLLYIGHTTHPLKEALHEHFFKEPGSRGICLECVTRIEYACFATEADLNIMSAYYINQLKPALNQKDKAMDRVTFRLPDAVFQAYTDSCIDDWREQIGKLNVHDEERCKLRLQLEKEHQSKLCEIFSAPLLTREDKERLYEDWLKNVYEPVRNGLL